MRCGEGVHSEEGELESDVKGQVEEGGSCNVCLWVWYSCTWALSSFNSVAIDLMVSIMEIPLLLMPLSARTM